MGGSLDLSAFLLFSNILFIILTPFSPCLIEHLDTPGNTCRVFLFHTFGCGASTLHRHDRPHFRERRIDWE